MRAAASAGAVTCSAAVVLISLMSAPQWSSTDLVVSLNLSFLLSFIKSPSVLGSVGEL